MVEPQWNPSVENQAIARALRLGQKYPVLVTRYVVESSVEEVSHVPSCLLAQLTVVGYAEAAGYETRESQSCQEWMISSSYSIMKERTYSSITSPTWLNTPLSVVQPFSDAPSCRSVRGVYAWHVNVLTFVLFARKENRRTCAQSWRSNA